MINTSYASGLAYYLNSGSSEDLFAALSQRIGLLSSGASGTKTGITIETVNKMTDPEQKIIFAGQVAESLQMQTEIVTKANNPIRLKEITAQAEKILAAINDAVTTLKAKDTKAKEGQSNAGVKTCQGSIDTAMGTLHTVLGNIATLCGSASEETATTIKQSLKDMESTACSIARLSGTGWKSLFKGGTSVAGTSASSISSIIDMLA